MLSTSFTPFVGTAPATTTMSINGCASCQPALDGNHVAFNPYATESKLTGRLMGLRGAGLRWDLFALALGVGFAGVLGAVMWKKKRA